MRLIDADAEAKWCRNHVLDAAERSAMLEFLRNCSTIDAVPVVRCWECKHRDPENHHCDHPAGATIYFPRKDDDFCSYGERKDGEG